MESADQIRMHNETSYEPEPYTFTWRIGMMVALGLLTVIALGCARLIIVDLSQINHTLQQQNVTPDIEIIHGKDAEDIVRNFRTWRATQKPTHRIHSVTSVHDPESGYIFVTYTP